MEMEDNGGERDALMRLQEMMKKLKRDKYMPKKFKTVEVEEDKGGSDDLSPDDEELLNEYLK